MLIEFLTVNTWPLPPLSPTPAHPSPNCLAVLPVSIPFPPCSPPPKNAGNANAMQPGVSQKDQNRKEERGKLDEKIECRPSTWFYSIMCGDSAESPGLSDCRRACGVGAMEARACPFFPAAFAARFSGGGTSILGRGGKGFVGVRVTRGDG